MRCFVERRSAARFAVRFSPVVISRAKAREIPSRLRNLSFVFSKARLVALENPNFLGVQIEN